MYSCGDVMSFSCASSFIVFLEVDRDDCIIPPYLFAAAAVMPPILPLALATVDVDVDCDFPFTLRLALRAPSMSVVSSPCSFSCSLMITLWSQLAANHPRGQFHPLVLFHPRI